MKKQLISILLILLFLTSCAAFKTERKVVDNIFYSTFPKIKIKVNPDFKYMGKADEDAFHEHEYYMEAGGHPYIKEEKHVFVYVGDNSYSNKSILINFSTISGYYSWKLDFYSTWKNLITSGAVKIHGKQYQYAVQVTPKNYFVKHLCRNVGDKLQIAIVYVENAGDYNNLSRTEKRGLLKEFLIRSEKNIQILSDIDQSKRSSEAKGSTWTSKFEVPKLTHIPKQFEKISKTSSSIVITSNVISSDIYLAKVDNKAKLSGSPKWTIKKKLPLTMDGLEPGLYYLKLCWYGAYSDTDYCSKVDTVELKEGMLTRLKGYIDITGHREEAKGPTWTSKFEVHKQFEKIIKTSSSIVITSNVYYPDIYLAKVDNKLKLSENPKWTIKKKLPLTMDGLEPGLYYLKLCWYGAYSDTDYCSKVDTVELKEGMLTRLKGYIDHSNRPSEAKGPTWTSKFEKKE